MLRVVLLGRSRRGEEPRGEGGNLLLERSDACLRRLLNCTAAWNGAAGGP